MMIVRLLTVVQVRRSGARFTPDRQAIKREGMAAFVVRFISFFFLIAILVAYALDPSWMQVLELPIPPLGRWFGFAVGLLGVVVALWAQATIGRQWSAQLQLVHAHQLVTSGPYALVRHPIYAALTAVAIGLALMTTSWIFIAFGVLSIAMSIARIPREERMMRDEVAGYSDYEARVRFRVLPGLW